MGVLKLSDGTTLDAAQVVGIEFWDETPSTWKQNKIKIVTSDGKSRHLHGDQANEAYLRLKDLSGVTVQLHLKPNN